MNLFGQIKKAWQEFRCLIAETMMGWILDILPKGSQESAIYAQLMLWYFEAIRAGLTASMKPASTCEQRFTP